MPVSTGVVRWIPSAAWSGNAVIGKLNQAILQLLVVERSDRLRVIITDFEAWHPLWEYNNEHNPPRMNRYQNLSLQLVYSLDNIRAPNSFN